MGSRRFFSGAFVPVLVALLALGGGCGGGIYDGRSEMSQTRVINGLEGGELVVGQAKAIFPGGVLLGYPTVTLYRIPTIRKTGAYGPVFWLRIIPGSSLIKDATFQMIVEPIGTNHERLVAGRLDPSLPVAAQLWIPITDSTLDETATVLTASVTPGDYVLRPDWLLGAVVSCDCPAGRTCSGPVTCPEGQTCSGNACQQCPYNECPP